MYENVKIGIIGGDLRQVALSRRLSEIGFEVAVWGLPKTADIGNATRSVNWKSAINKSAAVVLPFPVSRDGVHLCAPYYDGDLPEVSQLLFAAKEGTAFFGGNFGLTAKYAAEEKNIFLYDYLENEPLQIKNTIPTAEGALEIALHETDITIKDSMALVCGFGRVGKTVARLLSDIGAKVYVSARNENDLAYITVNGFESVECGSKDFYEIISKVDVIFNTVPAIILDKKTIEAMKKDAVIIDLASGKGGTDFKAATMLGVKNFHALSLPGKVAPKTSGNIICDFVLDVLRRKGVIAEI